MTNSIFIIYHLMMIIIYISSVYCVHIIGRHRHIKDTYYYNSEQQVFLNILRMKGLNILRNEKLCEKVYPTSLEL